MLDWKTHRKQLLRDPKLRQELRAHRLEYEIARAIIKARIAYGLTQKQLAAKLKTKQSVISRLENAQTKPSLSSLERLANILGARLEVRLGF